MSGTDGNSGGIGASRRSFGEDQYATPSAASPDVWDIRKKKAADLERLRLESRLKARLKTDEELGLGLLSSAFSRLLGWLDCRHIAGLSPMHSCRSVQFANAYIR
ncbi:unnamed protein product [Strongylus vulgaris]|uniref:Uncharacterized protein n=1 Tax=Strongylus vulgaris TaxID=40348 RepID=A0A3P7IJS2_STRVU|nr:unnamed protein product [Strongylus vulgaris]